MSGPKVIDVVPREEMIDICRAAIAEVDYALSEWQRIMERNMIVASHDLTRFKAARDSLVGQLTAGGYRDIRVAAPRLAAQIQESAQHHLVEQNSKESLAKRQEQALRFSAGTLLARCSKLDGMLSSETLRLLADAAAGKPVIVETVAEAISKVTAALNAREHEAAASKQHALAEQLGATGEMVSATEILEQIEETLTDPRISRISLRIAELTVCGLDDKVPGYRMSLEDAVRAEAAGDRSRNLLLLESLELRLAADLKRARLVQELRRDIGVETAAVHATMDSDACGPDLQAANVALGLGDLDTARRHIERAKDLRLQRRKRRSAEASRTAILNGLKELGYEVREGMATQWAGQTRFVVKHAAKPGVALELAGTLDGGRLQARMVALQGSNRDPHADKQTEETWCSEFELLRKSVADSGGSISVVKALEAGIAPLKSVVDDRDEDERRDRRAIERRL